MGCEENEFSENYLILKTKEATVGDVISFILPSGSRKIKNLIDCPDGKEESYSNFEARWTIFVSILLQKFLLAVTIPLVILGKFRSITQRGFFKFMIGEFWRVPKTASTVDFRSKMKCKDWEMMDLNATMNSGEFWRVPETTSTVDFRSKVKCKDWEIMDLNDTTNLDDNDFRYYGALSMMASNLAYQDYSFIPSVVNGCWQMNLLGCYHFWNDFQNRATTHAFMFQTTAKDPNVTVVAFRGTSPFDAYDWMVDINLSWYKIKGVGYIHSGFMQALGLQKATGWPKDLVKPQHNFAYYTLREKLRDIAKSNDNAKFIITGHSLGGALATLFVTLLALHQESAILEKLQAVYTFGQPRVGDQQFAEFMVKTVKRYGFKHYRYVYSFDLVPRVPFDSIIFKYKHFGRCVYFDCCYNGKFLKEQPNTNYFSLIWLIPKYLSAWWELIRSLIIIPLFKGKDYFEGFVTILLRIFGLFIPGLSAHISPNYINLTRWGKIKLVPDHKATLMLAHSIEAD